MGHSLTPYKFLAVQRSNRGDVLRFALDPSGIFRACLVDNVPVDRNALVSEGLEPVSQAAESLNDAGQIAGYGVIRGETHASRLHQSGVRAIPIDSAVEQTQIRASTASGG